MATTTFDWQTGVALGIGLVALAYLVRRWWPSWRGLGRPPAATTSGACHPGQQAGSPPAAACGQGCGGCGQARTPRRDHRAQRTVARPTPSP